jgi:hypothetical protein
MDLQKMIADLRVERDRLDQAILALERLSDGNQKRRGRPPKLLREKLSHYLLHAQDEELNSQPGNHEAS